MALHVHRWGDAGGPPLVCLHGVMSTGYRFAKLARERLGRFRVLAPDLRGHGDSPADPPWRIETFVADVLEVADEAGVTGAPWIGHSFGGRLILELAAIRPELASRVVLLDPAIQLEPGDALERAEADRADASYEDLAEALAGAQGDYPLAPRDLLAEELPHLLGEGEDGRLRPRYLKSAVIAAFGEMAAEPPAFETLTVPVLLVVCERESVVRPEQVERMQATLGARLQVVTVPGGHSVLREAFDETADAVAAFLQDAGAEGAGG